jgi:quinol monooxygenase YgiN
MIVVIAELHARAGQEKELEQVLQQMITPTRQEPGCIRYELNVSLSDPAVFIFYERWQDQAALDGHLKTPHMSVLHPRAGEFQDIPARVFIGQLLE